MSKVFEDFFSEIQSDMVSICLEYVEKKADEIYIYCSCEEKVISSDFFYKVNDMIVRKHKLNDALYNSCESFSYDTSAPRQKAVMNIINEDIEKLYYLCSEYKREMPTEIKLVYNVKENSLDANYKYDLVYSTDLNKTADDIAKEWFDEISLG